MWCSGVGCVCGGVGCTCVQTVVDEPTSDDSSIRVLIDPGHIDDGPCLLGVPVYKAYLTLTYSHSPPPHTPTPSPPSHPHLSVPRLSS